ncbi:MAG: EAL domain-containing protein [Treponema sp.]|nr:EAL domain-containing protein [Treponema sp.]
MNNFFFFTIGAFFISITVMLATYSRKLLNGRTNKLAFLAQIVVFAAVVCKIIYTFLLSLTPSFISNMFINFFVYVYLISYYSIIPTTLLFCCSYIGIWHLYTHKTFFRFFVILTYVFVTAYVLVNPYFHHLFYIENTGNYLQLYFCPGEVVLIYSTAFSMLVTLFLFIIYGKYCSEDRNILGVVLYFVNLTIFLFDYYCTDGQIAIFLFSMTTYMVSATAQRPELLIDPVVKTASANSFFIEAKKSFLVKHHTDMIFIKIINYKNLELYLGQNNYDHFLEEVANRLTQFSKQYKLDAQTFYLGRSSFVLPSEGVSSHQLKMVLDEMKNWFHSTIFIDGFDVIADAMICIVRCPEDISNLEYLNYFSKNIHHIMPHTGSVMWLKDFTESNEFRIKNDLDIILERAIDNNFFEVHYQPIYGIKEDRYVSVEALVRLNDPVYGYIPPALFLKLAETTGDILKIGDFVLSKVINFISSEDFARLNLDYVEINLSDSQCSEKTLVDIILARLKKKNISPDKIRLEITESAMDTNPEQVEKNIKALHDAGVVLALDDYGIGYSNIKKAIALPLDVVKLDKVFVDELNDDRMQLVIKDTIFMLKQLNKTIFVEGIENVKAVEFFRNLTYENKPACEYIQGYYYSKPLPERELISFLRNSLI